MAWMQCRSCSARYAVGLLRCPQCQAVSELFAVPEEVIEAEQEATVPKISVEGGPSNALGQPVEDEPVPTADAVPEGGAAGVEDPEPAETETSEAETSDATSDATDEVTEVDEGAVVAAEPGSAPAPKPARKTAAKKTAAKPESASKG